MYAIVGLGLGLSHHKLGTLLVVHLKRVLNQGVAHFFEFNVSALPFATELTPADGIEIWQ